MTEQNRTGEVVAEELPQKLISIAESPVERVVADEEEEATERTEDGDMSSATPDVHDPVVENGMMTNHTSDTISDEQNSDAQVVVDRDDAAAGDTITEQIATTVDQEQTTHEETDQPTADASEEVIEAPTVGGQETDQSAADANDTETVAQQTTDQPVAEEGAESTEAPGASFTPVEEDDARPRRLKDLEVGMELDGRVTSIALYGVFADIGVGRDGLVHISEMSDTRINSPSDLVQIGDPIKVRVKSVDLESRRISLTMRSQRESHDTERRGRNKRHEVNRDLLSTMKVGDVVEGTITGLSSFGAFVDIGVGKDGLVHISELSEGRVDKPGDAVEVGEQYNFKLLEVDPEGARISLSLRRAQRAQKMRQLDSGQVLDGTVSGLATFGAFVDIGVGRDGLVHISQLSEKRVEKVEDVVKVGDTVTVRVLEVDAQNKRISLTMRPETPEEPEASEDDTATPETAGTPVDTSAPGQSAPSVNREEGRQGGQGGQPGQGGPGGQAGQFGQSGQSGRRERDGQGRRKGSSGRPARSSSSAPPAAPEFYSSSDDDDETFEGNATLEDLVSKFGGRRKDRRRRAEDEEEDEETQRQRQREIIRRTLRQDENE